MNNSCYNFKCLKSGIYEYQSETEVREAAYVLDNDFAWDKETGKKVSISSLEEFIRDFDDFEIELYIKEDDEYSDLEEVSDFCGYNYMGEYGSDN